MSEKEFDITQHELYDCDAKIIETNKHLICLLVSHGSPEFNKQDVIAMAKHFKLTAEDLERG